MIYCQRCPIEVVVGIAHADEVTAGEVQRRAHAGRGGAGVAVDGRFIVARDGDAERGGGGGPIGIRHFVAEDVRERAACKGQGLNCAERVIKRVAVGAVGTEGQCTVESTNRSSIDICGATDHSGAGTGRANLSDGPTFVVIHIRVVGEYGAGGVQACILLNRVGVSHGHRRIVGAIDGDGQLCPRRQRRAIGHLVVEDFSQCLTRCKRVDHTVGVIDGVSESTTICNA